MEIPIPSDSRLPRRVPKDLLGKVLLGLWGRAFSIRVIPEFRWCLQRKGPEKLSFRSEFAQSSDSRNPDVCPQRKLPGNQSPLQSGFLCLNNSRAHVPTMKHPRIFQGISGGSFPIVLIQTIPESRWCLQKKSYSRFFPSPETCSPEEVSEYPLEQVL